MLFPVFLFFTLTFLFIFPKNIYAATCEIASWDENTRNLQVCIGGFSTKDDLKKATGEVQCLNNSNLISYGVCRGIQDPEFNLAGTADNMIAQDLGGKYYTCPIFTGINRAIGQLQVKVNAPNDCTTASIYTAPKDWDPLTEGLPWQQGTNNPIKEGSIFCPDQKSINTAIGCIPILDQTSFLSFVLKWAVGIGGGVAFLLIIYAGFMIMTAAGNPERLKAGQELLTSAISGLILLIFSVFILKFIGVDILGLGQFGFGK